MTSATAAKYADSPEIVAVESLEKRPNIAVIGSRGFPDVQGGVERHCEELYTRLAARHSVLVFTRAPYNRTRPRLALYRGVALRRTWSPKNKYFEAIAHSVASLLIARRMRIPIVHIHAIGPGLVAPMARLLGFRVVFTHHGFDYTRQKWGGLAKAVLRCGEWLSVRSADQVLAVSRDIAVALRSRFQREVICAPNGVAVPAEAATRSTGDSRFALTVARLVPEKGIHILFEAARQLEGQLALRVVGGADHRSAYADRIRSECPPNVEMLGAQPHTRVLELLQCADVFVLPSFHEGLPIALLEALACGVVCVASDIPPHREIIADGVNGFLFRTGDSSDLAQVLRKVSCLPEERRRAIAAEAITTTRNGYTWERTADLNSDAYSAIAAAS